MTLTLDEIVKKIDNADVVSFDIFDTLLHRRVLHPLDVFEMVKRYIMTNEKELFFDNETFVKQFPHIRATCESQARDICHKRYGHHEIVLDNIYERIFDTNPILIEDLNRVKKIELECEMFCFYDNKEVKKLYEYALSRNKIVVIASDMYLPTATLKEILALCGYKSYHHLFCSGDLKMSKGRGDLFPHISKVTNTRAEKIVHIGDNHHADFEMALKHNINGHYLDFRFELYKKNIYKNRNYNEDNNFRHFADSVIEAAIINLSLKNQKCSELHSLGYNVFGPLFTGYFLWIINNLKQKKVDKVLFFARDAYVIRQLYLKYASKFDVHIPEEYVYISRASSLLSSFTDYNVDRLWHLFSGRRKKSVKEKVEGIGLDVEKIKGEMKRVGFEDAEVMIDYTSSAFHNLLIRLPHEVQQLAKEKRQHIREYIKSIIGTHERIAILDIGWTGNMQGGFSRIAKLINPAILFDGYYLGTSSGLQRHNQLQDNNYSGYLVDNGHPFSTFDNVLVPGGIELLEFAFVAPHATTLDYKSVDGKIEPVFEKNAIDEAYYKKASELQKGAFEFIDEIIPMILKVGIENFMKINWAQPFYNFACSPTESDAFVFGSLTHSDSATDTKKRLPLATKLPAKLDGHSPEYREEYDKAIWKKGFEALNLKK